MITPCPYLDCENRTEFGYCKTTACINPMHSNIGTVQYGQGVQRNRITNADRIRSMTDEELAKEAAELPCCPPGADLEELCFPSDVCENTNYKIQCWLNWLKQEVKE